jgi:hypothetical protein
MSRDPLPAGFLAQAGMDEDQGRPDPGDSLERVPGTPFPGEGGRG